MVLKWCQHQKFLKCFQIFFLLLQCLKFEGNEFYVQVFNHRQFKLQHYSYTFRSIGTLAAKVPLQ